MMVSATVSYGSTVVMEVPVSVTIGYIMAGEW